MEDDSDPMARDEELWNQSPEFERLFGKDADWKYGAIVALGAAATSILISTILLVAAAILDAKRLGRIGYFVPALFFGLIASFALIKVGFQYGAARRHRNSLAVRVGIGACFAKKPTCFGVWRIGSPLRLERARVRVPE